MYCCDRSNVRSERSQSMPRSIGQCSEPQLARAPEGTSARAARMTTMRQGMECILLEKTNSGRFDGGSAGAFRYVGGACASGARRRIGGGGGLGGEGRGGGWERPRPRGGGGGGGGGGGRGGGGGGRGAPRALRPPRQGRRAG